MNLFSRLFGKKEADVPKNTPPSVDLVGQPFHLNLDVNSKPAIKRQLARCANLLRAMESAKPEAKAALEREYLSRKQNLVTQGYKIERDNSSTFDALAKEID